MADGPFRELGARLGEWFLRRQVLQAARARLPRPDGQAARAFEQARLLRQVARQLAEPQEDLPPGRRPAVLLTLYRDLVYWALVAKSDNDAAVAPHLAPLWQQTPSDRLRRAAGSAENVEALRRLLVDLSPVTSLDATDEEVARVRAFADLLYEDLEAPRRQVDRILIQRWLRLAAAGAAVLTMVFAIRAIIVGPNLAARRPFRTSSTLPECATGSEACADIMFHTLEENGPWVEFDLDGTKSIHRIDVRNRARCCRERAVPLIAEVSTDRVHWKEVARQTTDFSTWTAKLPRTPAAYLRLRVPRVTYLHLADVKIH